MFLVIWQATQRENSLDLTRVEINFQSRLSRRGRGLAVWDWLDKLLLSQVCKNSLPVEFFELASRRKNSTFQLENTRVDVFDGKYPCST